MAKRVLIVDDEPDVLETLAELVQGAGYEVVTRLNFEDARKDIANDPPDILVTDVRLGPFNGLQLAVLMRATRPESPIVVLSAYDDPTLRLEAAHCPRHLSDQAGLAQGTARVPGRPVAGPGRGTREQTHSLNRRRTRLTLLQARARFVRAAAPGAAFVPVDGALDGDRLRRRDDRAELLARRRSPLPTTAP